MSPAMQMLFGTDTGLLSLFTIGFIIAMAIFLAVWFTTKSREPGSDD